MAEEGFRRKLTAILSADVEGYSRLMGGDEEATVANVKCLSYSRGVTYHLVIDIVKSNFDIKRTMGILKSEKRSNGI
jgi:hypothetical protein